VEKPVSPMLEHRRLLGEERPNIATQLTDPSTVTLTHISARRLNEPCAAIGQSVRFPETKSLTLIGASA
jgi:hypothetical protein